MSEGRPVIRIKPHKKDRLLEFSGWTLLLVTWLIVALSYKGLPDKIPSHFDFMGNISGWGTKYRIFFLPAVSTFVFLLITYFNYKPHTLNYPVNIDNRNAYGYYFVAVRFNRWVKILVSGIFLVISIRTIRMAHGDSGEITFWTLPLLIVLILIPMTALLIYLFKRSKEESQKGEA